MTTKKSIKALERAINIAGSQNKLSKLVGCSQQHISNLVAGKHKIPAEVAMQISKATGVPFAELRPDLASA